VGEGLLRFEDGDDGWMALLHMGMAHGMGNGTGLDMMNETKLQHLFASI
jgi:hypothetical protein